MQAKKKNQYTLKNRGEILYHTQHTPPVKLLYPHVSFDCFFFFLEATGLVGFRSRRNAATEFNRARCNSGIGGMQRFVCATRSGMKLLLSYRSGIGPKGGGERPGKHSGSVRERGAV